jgi:hypothetical protein
MKCERVCHFEKVTSDNNTDCLWELHIYVSDMQYCGCSVVGILFMDIYWLYVSALLNIIIAVIIIIFGYICRLTLPRIIAGNQA